MMTFTFGGSADIKASETMSERVLLQVGEELCVLTSNEARGMAAALMLEADKADVRRDNDPPTLPTQSPRSTIRKK